MYFNLDICLNNNQELLEAVTKVAVVFDGKMALSNIRIFYFLLFVISFIQQNKKT